MSLTTPGKQDDNWTTQGEPARVVNLVKDFDKTRAVDDVSIDIRAGEFLSLLGPSGSGKTTILMTIAGFEEPSSGNILIGERSVANVPPNRRNIGMVFQNYALFPHMTVFENVAFPLKRRRMAKREIATQVGDALEMVRLDGYESRKPSQLSGGQQQRVALARASVFRPPLLLMDEPLGALDKKLREQVQLEIKHLQRRLGTTVIYVTHDQDEALAMSDRVAVLNEGRLEQIGTPQELYEHPVNGFVADFIGETNFVSGTLVSCEGGACTIDLGQGAIAEAHLPEGETVSAGSSVQLALRPHRVRIGRPDEGIGGQSGTVRETVYSGESVAVIVELAHGDVVTARTSVNGSSPSWRSGDLVEVGWERGDARVYEVER